MKNLLFFSLAILLTACSGDDDSGVQHNTFKVVFTHSANHVDYYENLQLTNSDWVVSGDDTVIVPFIDDSNLNNEQYTWNTVSDNVASVDVIYNAICNDPGGNVEDMNVSFKLFKNNTLVEEQNLVISSTNDNTQSYEFNF